jgi:hypothetical protein
MSASRLCAVRSCLAAAARTCATCVRCVMCDARTAFGSGLGWCESRNFPTTCLLPRYVRTGGAHMAQQGRAGLQSVPNSRVQASAFHPTHSQSIRQSCAVQR